MKTLYPELQPSKTFFLDTDSKHKVYVEESGNPNGIPVIFLHGGPCSGTKPDHRRFFNPELYRIILFDQRGCGLSQPFGELEHNNTQGLIADMEQIRQHLHIKQWLVFGGSWGTALALLYAQQHTAHVSGLIVRAAFLVRQKDVDWLIKDGAGRIYPEQWQKLLDSIPETKRDNILQGLCKTIWGDDELAQRRVTKEWLAWNGQVALGNAYLPSSDEHISEKMVKQVAMELHYAKHHYFISENQILDNCHKLQAIPTRIIHGRMDIMCPIEAGETLHHALPHADYVILPTAGHVAQSEDMIDALVSATDWFAAR